MLEIQHPLRRLQLAALLGMLSLLAACAPSMPRSYVVLVPNANGAVGKVIVSGQKGEQVLTRAGQIASLDGRAVESTLNDIQLNADFGEAKAALPSPPEHFELYFISGGTRLTDASEAQFTDVLNRLRTTKPAVELVVIGHTDTVGGSEDNVVLSRQRARAVADRLQATGLKVLAMTLESHGKAKPKVPTPDGVAEPRNRRVEVTLR